MKTVSELGGELVMNTSDPMYGYLTFPIEGGRVGRKILPVEGPRFYTFIGNKAVSNNLKGLLGLENVPLYSDLKLTEGITDHLTFKELGYGDIVCSLGAGISDYQAYLLRGKTVFSFYDRDYTGFKKARAAQGRLAEYGSNLVIFEIPERFGRPTGKIDISSAYTTRGARELKEWIDYEVSKYSDNDKGYISLMSSSEKLEYFPTGISVIDEALEGGFTQGLYGIGGETSTGKSTVAVILAKAFVKLKKGVVYQSYELPKRQIWSRYASTYSKYSWVEIERNPSIMEMQVRAHLEEDSNYLKVATDYTREEFFARVRHYPIIIVDYLQRMPRMDKDTNASIRLNNEFLSELSMQGKTVIILSSMPRSAYGHSDSVPSSQRILEELNLVDFLIWTGDIKP
jgi:archaellum biogenesis ATPase FlaH